MGIDVLDNKAVVFNDGHDDLVVTCARRNPYDVKEGDLRIKSIFRRVQAKKRAGDGNPLIYALKGKGGFTIHPREAAKFVPDFKVILGKVLDNAAFEMVVPMPSAYGISSALAHRVVRTSKYGAVHAGLLRKKNQAEILAELQVLKFPAKTPEFVIKLAISLRKKLEKGDGAASFSMKEVDTLLRPYIQPLTLVKPLPEGGARILLVDDLMSTGATMVSAKNALKAVYPKAYIEGLCLLSRVFQK